MKRGKPACPPPARNLSSKKGPAMKFVFACDSFKGSISSERAAELLRQSAARVFPGAECACLPVADGGEGTAEAVVRAAGGRLVSACVEDPLGRPHSATYGLLPNGHAVIEMAEASGLPLLSADERNPLLASTYGTGQLIMAALDEGATSVSLAIGGSATNDGGMGCMRALGARFLDTSGGELVGCGQDLACVASIDLSGLDARVAATEFTVMCDVDNPLLGPRGCAVVFAPQKGASPQDVAQLEQGMASYEKVLRKAFGTATADAPGAGAAGGLGAAARLFLGAKMVPGVDWVLDLVGLPEQLQGASLCVTGEGHADAQSAHGKVVSGVAARCAAAGVPCVAVVGGMNADAQELLGCGVGALVPAVIDVGTIEDALAHAENNFSLAADRVFMLLKLGQGLAGAATPPQVRRR